MSRRVSLRSRRARIIAAALGAVVVAELAVWALSPEQPGPAAVAVDALDYLDAGRLQQALDFRAETRVLGLLGIALELAALGLLTLGRPRFAGRWLRRFEARPLLGAAAAVGCCRSRWRCWHCRSASGLSNWRSMSVSRSRASEAGSSIGPGAPGSRRSMPRWGRCC